MLLKYILTLMIIGLLLGSLSCKQRRTPLTVKIFDGVIPAKDPYPNKFVTDLEGRSEGLLNNLKERGLELVNGQLEFIEGHTKLFVGGDLSDRGADCIKIRRWLISLKQRHPDRVRIIWGNRELNKLGLLYVLPLLQTMSTTAYMPWVHERGGKSLKEMTDLLQDFMNWAAKKSAQSEARQQSPFNSAENITEWFFEKIGCENCLKYHQQELEELWGRKSSKKEAAEDYIRSLDPKKGEFFKFLELGQFVSTEGRTIMAHGQLGSDNIGLVPGVDRKYPKIEEWVQALNTWGTDHLKNIKKNFHNNFSKSIASLKDLVQYGDSVWDIGLKKGYANEFSVVHATRNKEGNNFRLPSRETIHTLKQQGFFTLIVGHSPAGNVPLTLRGNDFLQIMADTSYGVNGKGTVGFDSLGQLELSGTLRTGELIKARVSPFIDSPIGKLHKGAHVIGRGVAQRYSHYSFRYNADFSYQEFGTPESLDYKNTQMPYFNYNHTRLAHRSDLIEFLEMAEIPALTLKELKEQFFKEKRPLFISTDTFDRFESMHGDKNAREAMESLLRHLDPKEFTLITHGTKNGLEERLHSLARKRGFEVVAALSDTAIPQYVNRNISAVTLLAESTHDLNLNVLNLLKQTDGKAVFIKGGPQTSVQIELAEKLGIDFWALLGSMGASHDYAKSHKSRAFTSGSELASLIKKPQEKRARAPRGKSKKVKYFNSGEARSFFSQQNKEVITIDLTAVTKGGYLDYAIMGIETRLDHFDAKRHVINIAGNPELVDVLYEKVKSRGFETAKLVPIENFTSARTFSQHIDHILVMNSSLEVETLDAEILEQVLPKTKKRGTDVEASRASHLRKKITPMEIKGELNSMGKELVPISFNPQFLEISPEAVAAKIHQTLQEFSPARHVISFSINESTKGNKKGMTPLQKSHFAMAYHLAINMGFQTASIGLAGDKIFEIKLPSLNYYYEIDKPLERNLHIFRERIKPFSIERIYRQVGQVKKIGALELYHNGVDDLGRIIMTCDSLNWKMSKSR